MTASIESTASASTGRALLCEIDGVRSFRATLANTLMPGHET
jgi:hypothetical protein